LVDPVAEDVARANGDLARRRNANPVPDPALLPWPVAYRHPAGVEVFETRYRSDIYDFVFELRP
jgi:hypothetical protein